MSRSVWTWVRVIGPVVVLTVLVWHVGTGPFLDGVNSIDAWALVAAVGIALLTTVCCAWRWTIIAAALGVDLSRRAAVAAYYRSQFLNVTLPGGVVGDVERAVRHGRDVGDVGRAVRVVVLDRFAGQVVQVLVTIVVLLALPSPIQSSMTVVAPAAVVALGVIGVAARPRRRGVALWRRIRTAVAGDIRAGMLTRRAWLGIVLTSALVVAGHAMTFLIAARVAGTAASPSRMLPIALLAMMAMVLPSIGGWGPREGVTAWAFAAAGLGAGRGVTTGVIYGVMVLVASLPGAAVLAVTWFRCVRFPRRKRQRLREGAAHA